MSIKSGEDQLVIHRNNKSSKALTSGRKRELRFLACLCKESSYLLFDLITLTVWTFDSRHRIKLTDRKKYCKLLAAFVAQIVVFRHACPPMQSYLFLIVVYMPWRYCSSAVFRKELKHFLEASEVSFLSIVQGGILMQEKRTCVVSFFPDHHL